ncbi:MAG TPA: type I methionyl aminopeptidase [Ruminococcaceae bacterium]|nr:type I methionyl aminopeptidase [Oscillospiraceae bacterium]
MVVLKTNRELMAMKDAGKISAQALQLAGETVKAGMSTYELDHIIHNFIKSQNAIPSFLGYGGYPASSCISINDEVIHGIPSKTHLIKEGDIVSVDVGAYYNGYHGDNAATFAVGKISDEARQLLEVTKECLKRGIAAAVAGARIGDISYAVQSYAEGFGYGVVRKFVGHGIGKEMHESPEVPNYGNPGHGLRLMPGMTIAIEPMINIKGHDVKVMSDGWLVKTTSGSLSAHFEHTIAITDNGPVIMTMP